MKKRLIKIASCIGIILISGFEVKAQPEIFPQEKVYIHTDRVQYGAGEDIYFSAYLTEQGFDISTILSQVLYIELINSSGVKISFQQLKLDEGRAAGSIEIPYESNTQVITLRAYTSYMRNFNSKYFYRKRIQVMGNSWTNESGPEKMDLSIQAFPEGGALIDGIVSILGVKMEQEGQGIEGEIEVYQDGESINSFDTNKYGFGKFVLKPEYGSEYKLSYEGLEFSLPEIQLRGVNIRSRTTKDLFTLYINEKGITDIKNYKVMILAQGGVLYYQALSNPIIKLEKATLPTGLITIAILDSNDKPIAERLLFNHHKIDEVVADLEVSETSYAPRQKVSFTFEVFDTSGIGKVANLSISVLDHRYYRPQDGIVDNLLLTSDIKGRIEYPHQYVQSNEKDVIERTDMLLLTKGWRNYDWTKTDGILYPKERNLSISGRTVKPKKPNEGVKTYGSISLLDETFQLIPFETDEQGYFFIDNVALSDSVSLFFQAGTKKPKDSEKVGGAARGNTNIDVLLDKPMQHGVGDMDIYSDEPLVEKEDAKTTIESDLYVIEPKTDEDEWYIDEGLLLDEVTIKEKKFDKWVDYYDDVTSYKDPDSRIFTDNGGAIEAYTDIYGVLRGRVPGIEITASVDGQSQRSVIIRGRSTGLSSATAANNAASFMLNGSFISAATAESIQPMDIAYIDVLKGLSQLAQYGELGAGGIIAIYLKPPGSRSRTSTSTKKDKGIYLDYQGFSSAKEFYKPTYGAEGNYEKITTRRTIHWEPLLETDKNGELILSFYTSDYLGTYHIDVQGITEDGVPLSYRASFVVDDGL